MESTILMQAITKSNKEFITTLKTTLKKHNLNTKAFSEISRVPENTLYKIMTDDKKDFRISTYRAIINSIKKIEGTNEPFIAVITSRSVLDRLKKSFIEHEGKKIMLKEFPALNIEEVITKAVNAEKQGAKGIICGPIAAASIRNIVSMPVAAILLDERGMNHAIETIRQKL